MDGLYHYGHFLHLWAQYLEEQPDEEIVLRNAFSVRPRKGGPLNCVCVV